MGCDHARVLTPPPPPPVVVVPDAAYLVGTEEGQRLALSIPVRARPAAAGRTTVRLRATVRLPNGANLRPTPSTRQHADRAAVDHVVLFSPASTRRLTRMAVPPKVTIRAFAALDEDGDGAAEVLSDPMAVVTTVPRPRRRPPEPSTGTMAGGDPCGAAPGCVVVSGAPWAAPHRWSTYAWRLACPTGTTPGAVALDAGAAAYVASSVVVGGAAWVEVTDDGLAGHPVSFAPSVACLG